MPPSSSSAQIPPLSTPPVAVLEEAEVQAADSTTPSVPAVPPTGVQGLTLQIEAKIFVSTFITIFLAELGDKTQLTTLLMSAESQSPWIVFLGAGAALVTTSLIGVLVGRWLSNRISEAVLEKAVGTLLISISLWLVWDIVHL